MPRWMLSSGVAVCSGVAVKLVKLPCAKNPSWLHTTAAISGSQGLRAVQTVPQCPPKQTSTLPLLWLEPPTSLTSVSLHSKEGRSVEKQRHTY